ncbi:MAG: ABC transporter permease [Candidatus Dormibacteraeota bacterium]|nr:ABC transporter permease [Candidatus Dormibacteraeota bacterium]
MPPALTIARLTIWEASRRKVLLALVILTVLVIAATGWGFTKLWDTQSGARASETEVRLIASQLLIVITFMFAGVLALSSVFVAAPSISADLESGLLLAMLARPVRRLDLLLGRWLGLAVLIICYAAFAGALELLVLWATTGYVPPHPVTLVVFVAGQGLILVSLALALSTRLAGMAGGIIALVGYFVAWIGGIVGGFGQALGNESLKAAGTIINLLLPTDGLWRGAVYAMEPASVLAAIQTAGAAGAANPFGAAHPPPVTFLAWSVFWVVAVLGLAYWSLRHRQI